VLKLKIFVVHSHIAFVTIEKKEKKKEKIHLFLFSFFFCFSVMPYNLKDRNVLVTGGSRYFSITIHSLSSHLFRFRFFFLVCFSRRRTEIPGFEPVVRFLRDEYAAEL